MPAGRAVSCDAALGRLAKAGLGLIRDPSISATKVPERASGCGVGSNNAVEIEILSPASLSLSLSPHSSLPSPRREPPLLPPSHSFLPLLASRQAMATQTVDVRESLPIPARSWARSTLLIPPSCKSLSELDLREQLSARLKHAISHSRRRHSAVVLELLSASTSSYAP